MKSSFVEIFNNVTKLMLFYFRIDLCLIYSSIISFGGGKKMIDVNRIGLHVRVEAGQELKNMIISRLKAKYERERIGLHVTDLIWPRLYVFRKLERPNLTEKDVLFYALGSGEGEVLEAIVSEKREVAIEKDGIIYTPDAIIKVEEKNVPVEIKTTRQTEGELVRQHYLLQLASYCTALEVDMGILLIIQMNNTENPLKVFNIKFEDEELECLKKILKERRQSVEEALAKRKPELAPCAISDPNLNWKCKHCRWRTRCDGIERMKL